MKWHTICCVFILVLRRELFRNILGGMLILDPVGFLWVLGNQVVIIYALDFPGLLLFLIMNRYKIIQKKREIIFDKIIHFYRDSTAELELILHFQDSLSNLFPILLCCYFFFHQESKILGSACGWLEWQEATDIQ